MLSPGMNGEAENATCLYHWTSALLYTAMPHGVSEPQFPIYQKRLLRLAVGMKWPSLLVKILVACWTFPLPPWDSLLSKSQGTLEALYSNRAALPTSEDVGNLSLSKLT